MTPIPQSTQDLPRVATPKTAEALGRLMSRREELRSQVNALTEQRGDAAHEAQRLLGDPLREGPEARVRALDARIARLELEVQAADNAIAEARANGLEGEETQVITIPQAPIPPVPPTPSFNFEWNPGQSVPWRDRFVDSLQTTGPITVATVVLIGALLYWRISRSMRNQFAKLLATQHARLDEIQRSVDTVAVEMERVSENQRFVTKLVGERQPAERR